MEKYIDRCVIRVNYIFTSLGLCEVCADPGCS